MQLYEALVEAGQVGCYTDSKAKQEDTYETGADIYTAGSAELEARSDLLLFHPNGTDRLFADGKTGCYKDEENTGCGRTEIFSGLFVVGDNPFESSGRISNCPERWTDRVL